MGAEAKMARYYLKLENGRFLTGEDIFSPPHGYKGPFNCATPKIARMTCQRFHEEHRDAGLVTPRITIYSERMVGGMKSKVFFEVFHPDRGEPNEEPPAKPVPLPEDEYLLHPDWLTKHKRPASE